MDNKIKNNAAEVTGVITSEPEFSHETYGEKFYVMMLDVERASGAMDSIPLTISDRLFELDDTYTGKRVHVSGQFRSYNKGNRLILSLFVRDIEELDDMQSDLQVNSISLDGYICKAPIYRKTPLGREIADVLIAVNRGYGKSDYIPCIAWGRNARFAEQLEIGTHVEITGRIQSRNYTKRCSDGAEEERTAYEVSVSMITIIDGSEE